MSTTIIVSFQRGKEESIKTKKEEIKSSLLTHMKACIEVPKESTFKTNRNNKSMC